MTHQALSGVVDPETGKTLIKYTYIIKSPTLHNTYVKERCKELGQISQGYGFTMGTNCVKWMTRDEIANIPRDRTVTYAHIVCDYRSQNTDPNWVIITADENLTDCPYELTTRTSDLATTKLLWSSVISTHGARYMCIDIKNMYLMTPIKRREYMGISVDLVPIKFLTLHNLHNSVHKGHI